MARIDPQHALTRAARLVNAHAEEHGLAETVEWLGLDVELPQLVYFAEQRALRALAARNGHLMGPSPDLDEEVSRRIVRSVDWIVNRDLLVAAYMDGMAIGWKARELREREEER